MVQVFDKKKQGIVGIDCRPHLPELPTFVFYSGNFSDPVMEIGERFWCQPQITNLIVTMTKSNPILQNKIF